MRPLLDVRSIRRRFVRRVTDSGSVSSGHEMIKESAHRGWTQPTPPYVLCLTFGSGSDLLLDAQSTYDPVKYQRSTAGETLSLQKQKKQSEQRDEAR